MNHLKIYYVIDKYEGPSSGTEKQLMMLITALIGLQHEVRLFVLRHTPYSRRVDEFPCPIECLNIRSARSIPSLRKLLAFRARIRSERPDVLHAFFNDAVVLTPLFCKTPGMLLLTARRDMGFWYTAEKLLMLRIANTRVDHIICNSHAVAREVARREHVQAEKLLVIHNGIAIDDPMGRLPTQSDFALMQAIEQEPDAIRICLVANLRRIKRIQDLIKAAAIICQEFPDCRFWIIGEPLDTRYESELHSLAIALGVDSRVRFFGAVSNPFHLIRNCSIGVLASSSEGMSNSILEYMHASLPVVCSEVGGNTELVDHGKNGYMYQAGDVDLLAHFLMRLIGDESMRARMGAASRAKIEQFPPEDLIHDHLLAYGLDRDEIAGVENQA